MPQLRSGAVVAHKDFPDGIVLANLVIVQNSHNYLHFLQRDRERPVSVIVRGRRAGMNLGTDNDNGDSMEGVSV